MTTAPVYTSKMAIIVGAVIALGAGIAIGATFVANTIDANSLAEYRNGAKVASLVTLSDDATGHGRGWNPGMNPITYQEGSSTITQIRELIEFNISDSVTTKDSLVYAVYTEERNVYPAIGLSYERDTVDVPCTTVPHDKTFTAYCGFENTAPKENSQLKYMVITSK